MSPVPYAIARTPIETREESLTSSFLLPGVGGTRTVRVRPSLKVEPAEEHGNPANEVIKTGDIVIREMEYRAYVDSFSLR